MKDIRIYLLKILMNECQETCLHDEEELSFRSEMLKRCLKSIQMKIFRIYCLSCKIAMIYPIADFTV